MSSVFIVPHPDLPFSVEELHRLISEADLFVKNAVSTVQMTENDLGFPKTIVDLLAHLHGLLDLAVCSVREIEDYQKGDPEAFAVLSSILGKAKNG